MAKKYPSTQHGRANHGWLQSWFHFSFAEYHNRDRMNFGALRVVNDDLVSSGKGFEMHPHRDMEIVSYVIDGKLTHEDSMGNKSTIGRGHIQYMSAGTGVYHSEYNYGEETARLLQIWIMPDQKGLTPQYGDYKYDWDLRKNKLLHLISPQNGAASVKLSADANLYALELDKGLEQEFAVGDGRQAYVVQIEGESDINGMALATRDALEVVEESLCIKAVAASHVVIIEMKKG
jgi:quercetin 2,3-dioxygenase